jgi:WD40 repeat protein
MPRCNCPRAFLGLCGILPAGALLAASVVTLFAPAYAHSTQPVPLGVKAVAFSPDGKLLAATTGQPEDAGTVTVWDVATQKVMWSHQGKAGIPAVAFAPDGHTVAVGSYDKTAKIFEAATGKERFTLDHPAEVRGVAFSPDGKLLATTCWDGGVRIWDAGTGKVKVTCAGPVDRLFELRYSPDGKMLVSVGLQVGLKFWDAESGMKLEKLKSIPERSFHRNPVFTADGRWLFTSANDAAVYVWDLDSGEVRARFGQLYSVQGLAYSPEAQVLAVASSEKYIPLLEPVLREPAAKEIEHVRQLLAKLDDDSYELREATSKELVKAGLLAEAALRQAAKESPSPEVRIRSRQALKVILEQPKAMLRGHIEDVECVAFAPGGKLLASGSKDGTVRLWDIVGGKESGRLTPK